MTEKLTGPQLKIEDVLEDSGGYGRFQKIFTFVAIVPQVTAAMIILSPVFTGTNKVIRYCHPNRNLGDRYDCGPQNCSVPTEDSVYSSIVQEWDLVCSRSWIVEAITSCQMAGMMSGALLSSLISDSFGRKKSFLFVTLGMGIFGSLPAFAFDPISYATSRFLAGLGMGGCFVVLLCHLMEVLTPKYRIICGSLSLWPVGEMLLGLSAYYIPSWRHLTVLAAAPILLIFLFFPFIQESPRWLFTQRRTREAYDILCKISKSNSKPPPLYATAETLQVNVLKEEEQVVRGFKAIKKILKNRELRRHLAILSWSNMTCSIVYYGLSFSAKSLSGSPYLNMLYMGILDLFAKPSILLFNNRLGTRFTFFLSMCFASVFLVASMILQFSMDVSQIPVVITILSLLGRFGVLASWGSLSCINLESFPTTLRATCLGFTVFTGYLGGIAAPALPLLEQYLTGLSYILYSFLAVSSAILCWFLRDMTGVPLMDTIHTHKR